MKRVLDTNVLIYFLNKNHKDAYDLVIDSDTGISVLTRMEIFAGLVKDQYSLVEQLLSNLPCISVNEKIADRAGKIIKKNNALKRHQIDVLLAATALVYDLELVTANVKDFKGIAGLRLREFVV